MPGRGADARRPEGVPEVLEDGAGGDAVVLLLLAGRGGRAAPGVQAGGDHTRGGQERGVREGDEV